MLAKSDTTPQGRLLSLFDILDDWLKAPHVQTSLHLAATRHALLIGYCTEQARALGAENPAILAEHIVLIAHSAAQQTLATHNTDSTSLSHAKKAAHALIQAQTQKPELAFASKTTRYGIAASLLLAFGIAALWLPDSIQNQPLQVQAKSKLMPIPAVQLMPSNEKSLSAHDATLMYAKYEQMRQGTCQLPEALLIPDKHKAIYLDNVVGGKLPANLADLAIANSYLEKVRCNFTPMLMAASK